MLFEALNGTDPLIHIDEHFEAQYGACDGSEHLEGYVGGPCLRLRDDVEGDGAHFGARHHYFEDERHVVVKAHQPVLFLVLAFVMCLGQS